MKKMVIIICVFTPLMIFAQDWVQLDVGTSENLNKIYFKDNNEGFIIGDNGTLLRTTNGGTDWFSISTGVSNNLNTITFLDADTGYINGLKTTDGGTTWTNQAASENFGLMYAQSSMNVIGCLFEIFSGDIYSSSTGGDDWNIVANPISNSTGAYSGVSFISDEIAYLSSWYSGHLIKTTDGGYNWTEVIIDTVDGTDFNSDDFRSIDFFSENLGLLTHQNGFIKTTDACNSWSEIKPTNYNEAFYPNSVVVNSLDNYIVVGRNNSNNQAIEKIYETNDGGISWSLYNGTIENLNNVTCNDIKCFAVGSNGTVFTKEIPLSTGAFSDDTEIIMYPNPTKEYLHIDIKRLKVNTIEIYDLLGRKYSQSLTPDNKIDTAPLPSGIYFLSITDNEKNHTIQFIKE